MTLRHALRDAVAWTLMVAAVPFLAYIKSRRQYVHSVRTLLDKIGVMIVANHYYEPVYVSSEIRADPNIPRALAGIDWGMSAERPCVDAGAGRRAGFPRRLA